MNRAADAKERENWFAEMVGALRADLFRFAYWLSRDRQIAEDLVQETLLRAWRARDHLKDRQASRHWLFTIVRREHARLYERKRLETVDIEALIAHEEPLLAVPEEPEVAELRNALLRLDAAYREPLVLQILFGYSAQEIADHMGINPGAVLTRLFRARNRLRKVLDR